MKDVHAIIRFLGIPPSIAQLVNISETALLNAGFDLSTCNAWNGNTETVKGYRVNMVYGNPPSLNDIAAVLSKALTRAGFSFIPPIAVYFHPLPPQNAA